jgi:Zn-dependent peptidase ImmA (M78 family)
LLHDWRPGEDFSLIGSDRADWPTEARANAFAAELVMPRDGVAELLRHRPVDPGVVRELLERFGVGVRAATRHLANLELMDEDTRLAILAEHARWPRPKPD